MTIQKLLQWTIVDALDEVWSKSGVIPSRRTRETIIRSAEKISNDVCEDFIKVGKQKLLSSEKWENVITIPSARKRSAADSIQVNHDEVVETMPLSNA